MSPSAQISLGPLANFPVGQATPVKVDGHAYIVVRESASPEEPCVVDDRCPHLGLSLTKGPGGKNYDNGVIVCPFHNSTFDVCSGENLDWTPGFAGRAAPKWSKGLIAMGRKPAPLTTYAVAIEDGQVVITP
jgi:nitrite reductase/ring-hydroxylating ferredoxin subunit